MKFIALSNIKKYESLTYSNLSKFKQIYPSKIEMIGNQATRTSKAYSYVSW